MPAGRGAVSAAPPADALVHRALAAAWTALLVGSGCAGDGGAGRCGPATGRAADVIDGDTIQLESGERIRYLMVDTPEDTSEVECFGPEATRFNADLVTGADLDLTYDQECTDDYDRVLAYVAVGGREVNSLLVQRGFGCALYIPPNGADRRDEFERLEAEARADRRGLWAACPETPCD
jgi:micrococcal nuclease